jgi:hypothetical protein
MSSESLPVEPVVVRPVPEPSVVVWRDYATDPPVPPNGYFLLIRKPGKIFETEGAFPVEAQRWDGVPGHSDTGFYQSDGEDEIDDDDILYWAQLPEVFLPPNPQHHMPGDTKELNEQ